MFARLSPTWPTPRSEYATFSRVRYWVRMPSAGMQFVCLVPEAEQTHPRNHWSLDDPERTSEAHRLRFHSPSAECLCRVVIHREEGLDAKLLQRNVMRRPKRCDRGE